MHRFPTVILVLSISFQLFGQRKEEYPSEEQTKYYSSRNFSSFKPVPKKIIKRYKPACVTIKKSPIRTNPFKSVWDLTPYREIYSKLRDSCVKRVRETKDWQSYSTCFSYVDSLEYSNKIGDISKSMILRVNSETNPSLILYSDGTLEDRNWGYWIGILDDGKWNYYYTGLTANHYFYIKTISTIDFQNSPNSIQVEAALVRHIKQEELPVGVPEYELVKDNLILEFDLNEITRDSDRDGLTDVMESKLRTNPGSSDSDNDGINDLMDKVPLTKQSTSASICVYNYLLNNPIDSCTIKMGDFTNCKAPDEMARFDKTYLIVSDEEVLKSVTSISDRLIVLTTEEFREYKSLHPVSPDRLYVTPWFKVDNMPNTYKIEISGSFWTNEYLIQKVEGDWKVVLIGMSII
jgi:hypothetical protein